LEVLGLGLAIDPELASLFTRFNIPSVCWERKKQSRDEEGKSGGDTWEATGGFRMFYFPPWLPPVAQHPIWGAPTPG
ncbi:unnamed protein product, partial [Allacma fusca]